MSNTIDNILKKDCTGCASCANSCPVKAISMVPNKEGFLFPKIAYESCINCGKCLLKCPIENRPVDNEMTPTIYAAYASDEIRRRASSGGIFTVLAEYVISNGGKVCGAVFDDDFKGVHHTIVDKIEDLEPLKESKYVQSSIGNVYGEIQSFLQEGQMVLFSGCGCQVAGLKNFLGKEYDNLITVDILCHGAPSPKAFRKYVDSVVLHDRKDDKIVDFSFRRKDAWGWSHSIYAKLESGYEYSKAKTQSSWYPSFINILNCRESCGNCQFNKLPRQGDITLGDFWGIDALGPNWNDGRGASIITLNSQKAGRVYSEIECKLDKSEKITLDIARGKNGNLVGSSKSHKERKRFFELLDLYDDYNKITEYSLGRKFDVGYVGWWYGKNYGSVMTNFALEQFISSLGYSVLMLEWPETTKPFYPIEDSFARRFGKKYYEIAMRRTYDELKDLNWFCDSFLVGSDQLWNYWSTKENGAYFFLNFVDDSRKKIAYATSFGHSVYGAPRHELENNAFHMNRFDYISVREKDGVDLCNEVFGVDAEWTIEPVFLLEQERYNKLVEDSQLETPDNYIFAYILSPSLEKREALLELSKQKGLNVILVLDAQADFEKNRNTMNMPESLLENIEMEDWLKLIKNASFVVTDSFHGLCFSMIFEKEFVCIGNSKRGLSRFQTLLEVADLEERMIMDPYELREFANPVPINYKKVRRNMSEMIDASKQWLKNALSTKKAYRFSTYDILMRRINELEKKIFELEHK